jgi:hypothetical protein
MRPLLVAAVLLASAGPAAADQQPALSRHQVGVQLGGSGPLQLIYRVRAVGPLSVEAGLFGAPPWAMASAGLVAETPQLGRWSLYAGAGAGAIVVAAEHRCGPADPQTCTDSGSWRYLHARAGVAVVIHEPTGAGAHRIAADIGYWRGTARDHAAGRMSVDRPFAIPMVGLSYLIGF